MKLGSYEIAIVGQDGRRCIEDNNGYVHMYHMETYSIMLYSPVRGVARIKIDGKSVGNIIVPCASLIERPVDGPARKFTFVAVNTDAAREGGQSDIPENMRGLVDVTFVPELMKPVKVYPATMDWVEQMGDLPKSRGPMLASGEGSCQGSLGAGFTALTEESKQRFREVHIDLDETQAATLRVRLVEAPKVHKVIPLVSHETLRETPIPPAVR